MESCRRVSLSAAKPQNSGFSLKQSGYILLPAILLNFVFAGSFSFRFIALGESKPVSASLPPSPYHRVPYASFFSN